MKLGHKRTARWTIAVLASHLGMVARSASEERRPDDRVRFEEQRAVEEARRVGQTYDAVKSSEEQRRNDAAATRRAAASVDEVASDALERVTDVEVGDQIDIGYHAQNVAKRLGITDKRAIESMELAAASNDASFEKLKGMSQFAEESWIEGHGAIPDGERQKMLDSARGLSVQGSTLEGKGYRFPEFDHNSSAR